jgi:hypothetical protein
MNTTTIALMIVIGVAIAGITFFMELSKTTSNYVIQLSATTETSPNNVKIHTLQQLSIIDSDTTVLDNSTLDQIPVLKNAIDQAFNRFKPPPFHDSHTFSTMISQSDADSIIKLAGNKVNDLPETQTNDTNLGVNFTKSTSYMEFKFNTLYYHVVIEKLISSQDNQSNNIP